MTERLSDVETRIETVHKLSAVIAAMRGIAAARSREAREKLSGIRAYAEMIGTGIGHAMSLLPDSDHGVGHGAASGRHAIIALCAEQGFAGAFSEHVLDAVAAFPPGDTDLLIIGDRGLMAAEERGLTPVWSASMIAHGEQAPNLANRIVEALYERLEHNAVARVTLVLARPTGAGPLDVVSKQLVPFDFARFPMPAGLQPPEITLQPAVLLSRLVEEYIFAELSEAVLQSFAAENEARMRAMILAHANVTKSLDELVNLSRQLRQEEITDEIVELAGSAMRSS